MAGGIAEFGRIADGRLIHILTLRGNSLRAEILTRGAALRDLQLDSCGWPLTLGHADLAAYEGPMTYAGAIVGPVANRIARASATIAGKPYRFEANENGRTTLHGGSTGTQAQVWSVADLSEQSATLALDLPDGLGGFPGNRTVLATYRIRPGPALDLEITARTDATTPVNLAQHSYWNLDGSDTTEGHRLLVPADSFLAIDEGKIPAGAPRPVDGTVFDFRTGRVLQNVALYDHNLCLADGQRARSEIAVLTGRRGVTMRIESTEPGLQIYDGQGLDSAPHAGHGGKPYGPFAGIALEPQGWPDAPNRPDYPSVLLHPGETYRQSTRYSFAISGSG